MDEFRRTDTKNMMFDRINDPFHNLPALAERLGVKPIDESENSQTSTFLQTKDGHRYDLFKLINALLNRMENKMTGVLTQTLKDLEDNPPVLTGSLRWHRPKGGTDNDIYLEQEWKCADGHTYWAPAPTVLED